MESNFTPFFQSLVNALSGSVCVLNNEFKVIAYNETFKNEMKDKFNLKASFNNTLYEQLPNARAELWRKILTEVLSGKKIERELVNEGNNTQYYTKAHLSPISDGVGNSGILVELKDVTTEKQNEISLHAFNILTENLPYTDVYLCDGKMNVLIAGGAEMKRMGNSYSYFIGKNMFDLAYEFNLQSLTNLYNVALRGENCNMDYVFLGNHYNLRAYPIMSGKRVEYVVLVSHNITDLKNVNLKLQSINEAKDAILSIVAHDLRNPITGILGAVELIKENPQLLNERLKLIESSSSLALSIISDLLDIGELGQDGYVLETELTEMNEFISEVVEANGVVAQTKKIALEFVSEAQHVFASINRDKFTRVLNNLIINSVKFSHPKQTVTIKLDLSWNEHILISVIDRGIGIPAELKDTIFESFTKASRKGTAGERSVGLGMSIVKQIVLLHKGDIWVESVEGVGTTVFIGLTKHQLD